MYQQLSSILKRPMLWERSEAPFWDDEHISKQMLDAHLNPDGDAASRKHSTIDKSVQWLTKLIPLNIKILDLGCGPGLYTKRFSDMGYSVTGMDLSIRSISYAKEQDEKSDYFCQNYLELTYTNAFDVVTIIYCDYGALSPSEREVLLGKVYQALKSGGLFILDAFQYRDTKSQTESTSWSVCEHGGFWSKEPYINIDATYFYENNTVSARKYVVMSETLVTSYIVWDTYYTVDTLTRELEKPGLQRVGLYGDICGNLYDEQSETLCLVMRKQ